MCVHLFFPKVQVLRKYNKDGPKAFALILGPHNESKTHTTTTEQVFKPPFLDSGDHKMDIFIDK